VSDTIATDRCPTCDQRIATPADVVAWRTCVNGGACLCPIDRCWAAMHGECAGKPVNWRTRALTANVEVLRLAALIRDQSEQTNAVYVERDRAQFETFATETMIPSRVRVAVADERRKVIEEVVAFLCAGPQDPGGMRATGWARWSRHAGGEIADAIEQHFADKEDSNE